MTRFELAASSSRTKRATGLRYIPNRFALQNDSVECKAFPTMIGAGLESMPSKSNDAQMLQQYLQSDENQYNTTNDSSRLLIFRTEDIAYLYTQDGEKESGEADDHQRRPQLYLDAGKRNTHRQGIDASGDSQKKHRLEIEGSAVFSFLFKAIQWS